MKLTEKIERHALNRPFYTFEFFPPRTDQGFENLLPRISRLSTLNPLAISVTWGAGGSTRDRSLDLAGLTQSEYEIDTLMHLTCTNMEKGRVDDALRAAKARGIQSILALRGDPPRGEESWIPIDPQFQHARDLVSYIRTSPEFSSDFCLGVAAYPDGHPDHDTDEDSELEHLKAKIDAGAEFIITQLFYDVDGFFRWMGKVRENGIEVPIIPGIMPLQTYASFLRLTKLCGTCVPPSLMADLDKIKHDDQKVKDYGVTLAIDMIRQLTQGGVQGFHFCTLNLEKSVQRVLEGLAWADDEKLHPSNKLISEGETKDVGSETDLTISPHKATDSAVEKLDTSAGGPGKGEVNYAATWDEFPNGRFGDFKSPAFGNQDPWGGSGISANEAVATWGRPTTLDQLTSIFLKHLHSEISTTPFSATPLSSESFVILPHLEQLTKRGWWTVGSQPAVDGANSTDEVFGWGPKGGYVYQKGFVEFFALEEDVERIVNKIDAEGKGWVDYFVVNLEGNLQTNVPDNGRNAVTWGVFPGHEIIQTTIIERESFLSWKEDAFSRWAEWASFYPPGSPERELLEGIKKERWLVSIVHHDYKNPEALWKFLFEGETVL